MRSEELALKMRGQLYLTLLNMVSLSEMYGRRVFKMNHATRFTNVCTRQITGINAPQNHMS